MNRGNPQNLRPPWKPGESGNPNGRPKKRVISTTILDVIEELGLERQFAIVAIAMALGRKDLLKRVVKDPETGKESWAIATPDFAWFAALREWLEGKVPDYPTDGEESSLETTTRALLEAMQLEHDAAKEKAAKRAKAVARKKAEGNGNTNGNT